jgi:hypothetical protein
MPFRDQLPASCPPPTAFEIVAELVMFRLVSDHNIADSDFLSQRAEKPNARFPPDISECHARGLSVFKDVEDARKKQALPRLRNKKICEVRLVHGLGFIEKTFSASHHTWWPFSDSNILPNCTVLAE